MKISLDEDEGVDVQMSPLIDCVFLLLIFFLVTNMMKKSEMQIPLAIPPMTSSLSMTQIKNNNVILSMDENKNVYHVLNHDAYTGQQELLQISDIDQFLKQLKSEKGEDLTIDIAAYRTVPIKTVIWLFDKCQEHGYNKTRVKMGSKPLKDLDNEFTR